MSMKLAAVWAAAYLLGAVPFGLLVGRLAGVADVRRQGSGNIGATNVLRAAGKKAGAATLLLDMGKGAAAISLARLVTGHDSEAAMVGAALAVFLGHLYPVWLGFKGGKGVATALGVFLAWTPWAGLATVLSWLLCAKLFRISSLAALTAFALNPLWLYLTAGRETLIAAAVITPLLFWRHRENIRRLLAGTEPRIGEKREASS